MALWLAHYFANQEPRFDRAEFLAAAADESVQRRPAANGQAASAPPRCAPAVGVGLPSVLAPGPLEGVSGGPSYVCALQSLRS